MKIVLSFFYIILLVHQAFPQSGWIKQESGTNEKLLKVRFIDKNRGIIIGSNGTILRTTNGGNNWEKLSGITNEQLTNITIFDEDKIIIIGGNGTILKTNDLGTTWIKQNCCTKTSLTSLSFLDDKKGVIVGSAGFYPSNYSTILITEDGGDNWKIVEDSIPKFKAYNVIFNEYQILIIGAEKDSYGEVFSLKSTDQGKSWIRESLNRYTLSSSYTSDFSFANSRTGIYVGWNYMMAEDHPYISKTIDGGKSWEQMRIPDIAFGVHCSTPDIYTITGRGTIYRTNNAGNSWQAQISGTSSLLYDVYFTDEMNGIAVGDHGTILHTSSKEVSKSSWQIISVNTTARLNSISFIDDYFAIAVGEGGTMLRTTDRGKTWNQLKNNYIWEYKKIQFKDYLGIVLGADSVYYTTTAGLKWEKTGPLGLYYGLSILNKKIATVVGINGIIRHTTNGCKTWNTQYGKTNVFLEDIDFADDKLGIAVGLSEFGGEYILKTTDSGNSWNKLISGYNHMLTDISAITTNSFIAIGDSGTILITTDKGESWSLQESKTTEFLQNVVFTDSLNGIVVGHSGIILRTSNGGKNWDKEIMTGTELRGVAVRDSIIICVGENGLILRSNTWNMSNTPPDPPKSFYLGQNYPNPFNLITTILFSVPKLSNVKVKIYDILGREIITLVDEEKAVGNHKVEFNGTSLPSGIYFYRLETGQFIETKKLILIK